MSAWSSYWDGHSRAPIRIGIAVIAAAEFAGQAYQISWQSQNANFGASGALARALVSVPGAAWLGLALIAVGLVLVAIDRRPLLGGVWALAWMALMSVWETEVFGTPSRNSFFPGAALFGWLLGLYWARVEAKGTSANQAVRRAASERLGEAGMLGCVAAAYAGSFTSKLLASGVAWADPAQVRGLVLLQRPLAEWGWLLAYRDAVLDHDWLARGASIGTLVIEGGALALLFGARLRLAWAVLLIGLHLNITFLCAMPYLEPMLLLSLVAIPWPRIFRARRRSPPTVEEPRADGPLIPRTMAWTLGAIVVAYWLMAPLGWSG